MMRNKKLIISISLALVIFLSGLLGFVIIPNALNRFRPASWGPKIRDSVSGNGGAAVMVGEYLYFTSGFRAKDTLEYGDNNHNNVRGGGEGGIWRVKMSVGLPGYDNTYLDYLDDWNAESKLPLGLNRFHPDQKYAYAMDMVLTTAEYDDLELIVPKVAGWENTAIWIFGDTLVYTSPNNQKDKRGQLQRDRIDIFQSGLDGSDHRKIYTTRTDGVGMNDFTVAYAGEPFLLIKDGTDLFRIDMRGRLQSISERCESAVFPVVAGYYNGYELTTSGGLTLTDDRGNLVNSYRGMMGYVYYTETRDEEEDTMRGNALWRADIATATPQKLRHSHDTHKLLALGNGMLALETTFEVTNKRELYIITDADASFADPAGLRQYTMSKPLEPEETLYLSLERTSSSSNYVTHAAKPDGNKILPDGNKILVYGLNQTEGVPYQPFEIPNTEDVEAIIAINAGTIMYRAAGGGLVTINYSGTDKQTANMSDVVAGARVTVFQVLDALGQINGTGYMFFYIKTVTEILPESTTPPPAEDEEPAPAEEPETLTVGTLLSGAGREYMLAELDTKKFVVLPENTVQN
jgi:hypothetical protein